jgi:hypothetical protein
MNWEAEISKQRSNNHAACSVGTWHLRRSTPLGEVGQGGTEVGHMAVERQEQMPSFEDHAAELSFVKPAEKGPCSAEQEPEHQKLEPMEPYIEVQRVVV